MILVMLIEFLSIAGSILLILLALDKGIHMSISGGKDSDKLGDGSKAGEKAKILDKPPLSNPNVGGGGNNQVAPQGNSAGNTNLPDMRGPDYGSYGGDASGAPDIASGLSGAGGGGGAVAMIGVVNAVGLVGQSGDVSNYNVAAKQVIRGPVLQKGTNIFTDKLKGSKRLLQRANNAIANNINGRTTLTQNGPGRTAISAGRANIVQRGATTSYLSGPVNRFRSGRAENLKLKAPLEVQKLIVQKFTASAGTSKKLRALSNGIPQGMQGPAGYLNPPMPSQPVIHMGVNNFNMRRITAVSKSNMVFTPANDGKMIGMVKAFEDPKNAGLSSENKNKMGAIISVIEQRESNIIPNKGGNAGGNISSIGAGDSGSSGNVKIEDVTRKTLVMFPKMPTQATITTAITAAVMMSENNKRKLDRANKVADEKTDPENVKRNTLDNMLSNTSSLPSIQFNKSIDEILKETHSISEERMEEIEKEAWEYVQASNDIPLEEKEAKYEEIKNKKIEEEGGITRDDLEEIVKQRIINNSEYAQAIIGEEGAKQLEDASGKAKEDRDKIVVQELIKQDVAEHAEYLKANPKARKKSYYDVYKERKDKEMEQNITVAASQLYANKGNDFDKQRYQQMPEYGNSSAQDQSQAQDTPLPLNAPRIFIARGSQERGMNGGV